MFQRVCLEGTYWFYQSHMRLISGLAQSMKMEVAQLCPTPCNPMDHESPWKSLGQNTGEVFPFSRESSQPRGQTQVSPAEPQGQEY